MERIQAYGARCLLLVLGICCCFGWCAGCLDNEKRVLKEIINSMGYQPEHSGSYSDDCCLWDGIACSSSSPYVVRISFYYTWKDEDMQPDRLPWEQRLPWFPDMNLFAQIKGLQELNLRGNHIGGVVNPEALCRLTNLQQLDLSYNSIEDDIHPCLASMSSLRSLSLSNNRFQGDLSILSNLSNLEHIDVSHNFFKGPLPLSAFADLSKLSHLDLSYNNQLDIESENPLWDPSFQLQQLLLAGCNLNLHGSRRVPGFISTQYNLQILDLSNNLLEGSFPAWLLPNVSSVLRLGGNSFVGEIPNDYQNVQMTLSELDISSNLLHGPLPSNISILFPNLLRFNASSNRLTGPIPPSLGELQNLQHLDLSHNSLSGFIPSGLTRNPQLWYLNLSNNSLTGELLPRDCNMTQLRWLLLQRNQFVGNISACLSNSPSLFMLDVKHNHLSGDLSAQLQFISRFAVLSRQVPLFSELGAFLLGSNQFVGYIPSHLCQMQKLQFLDLSNNDFSGSIPSCLRNNLFWTSNSQADSWVPTDFTTKGNSYSFQGIPLTLMSGIDLSANRLRGPIPSQLGELRQLHSLNLSNNLLIGAIPTSFGNLVSLESLDLSHNKLTGVIPEEMVCMSKLSTFDVAFNNLSGRIPSSGQFSTFSEGNFIGNPNLCGQPLPQKCSDIGNQPHQEENYNEENGIGDNNLVFYSFVFMSYSIGFLSVIGPLCFCKNWRRKYYAAIDRWLNYCF